MEKSQKAFLEEFYQELQKYQESQQRIFEKKISRERYRSILGRILGNSKEIFEEISRKKNLYENSYKIN